MRHLEREIELRRQLPERNFEKDHFTSRRGFIQTGAVAVGGLAFGAAFTAPACDKKDLSGQVLILVTSFNEIKPLLPDLGLSSTVLDRVRALLDKGVKIAKTFDDAYRAGKFDDAKTLFLSLGEVITSVVGELGLAGNNIVKTILVGVKIAQIVIANLLKQMASDPQVAAAIKSRSLAADTQAMTEIDRLAVVDAGRLLKLLQ